MMAFGVSSLHLIWYGCFRSSENDYEHYDMSEYTQSLDYEVNNSTDEYRCGISEMHLDFKTLLFTLVLISAVLIVVLNVSIVRKVWKQV